MSWTVTASYPFSLRSAKNASLRFILVRWTLRSVYFVSLRAGAGELVAVVGKSGSGKSTLANLIAGIDRPSSGEVIVAGTPVHTLPESRLASWRGRTVGVVFQFYQLLPTLTV